MSETVEFGTLLRNARIARGMSTDALGRVLGVSGSFVRRLERGTKRPTLPNFAALSRSLGFDANTLVDALGETVRSSEKRPKRAPVLLVTDEPGPFAAFGRGLAGARVKAQLTQEAVGHAIGCRRRHVARMEGGHVLPSIRVFARLRVALGFDANELVARLGENPPREPYFALGQILVAARVGRSLALVDVARSAGCEMGEVHEVERGIRLPTVQTLARMHNALGFSGDLALQAVYLANKRNPA